MTESKEEDHSPVRLRDMSTLRDPSNKDRLPSGPLKSPFSSDVSNRDSGIGYSPASVSTGGHFLFGDDVEASHDLESSSNIDDNEVFVESFESASYAAPPRPMAASTPVTEPIAIPRRQGGANGSGITTSARRPLIHRYSTGMFGNFPGEVDSRNIATQTPSPSSRVIEQAVQWQLGSNEYEFGGLPIEAENQPTARGPAVAYLRDVTSSQEFYNSNLPDIVPMTGRPRALSEPHVQPFRREIERSFGQELQRLGDDFHSSYHELRNAPIREEEPPELPSSFPGAAPAERGWWTKLKTVLSPSNTPTKNKKDDSERNGDKPKKL